MTFISDVGSLLALIFDTVYSVQLELLCVAVFLVAYLYGKTARLQLKTKPSPNAGKRPSYQNVKSPPRARNLPDKVDISCVDPAVLMDLSQLLPRLCRCQSTQDMLTLYKSATKAGLQLSDASTDDRQKLAATLLPATIRAGDIKDAMCLLSDLRQSGYNVAADVLASAVKLCTSKQLFAECLAIYDFMAEDSAAAIEDKSIFSCLIVCAIEAKAFDRCDKFFECLQACGTPSSKDFANMLRLCALRSDWQRSLSLIQEMRAANLEVDNLQYNTTLAACASAGKLDQACALLDTMEGAADVITYNTIMKGYAKAGDIDKCFELLEQMKAKSISSSQVTYGILLDCCINRNYLDRAMEVFNSMVEAGCPMNTVLCTTLIKGFARAGKLEKAMSMYSLMQTENGATPDVITFGVLIKANCDNHKLEDALQLLGEMFTLGLKPDEIIFNNLIAGCSGNGNAKLAKQLYNDMVKSGVRPSNATFSILIRVYHQCKLLDDAVDLLKNEPAKHNVTAEPRLYLQLIQSCIRARYGSRILEVYDMLAEQATPTATTHSTILSTCMRLNMYDTAVEIITRAAAMGTQIDTHDTAALLEAASKKGKSQVIQKCVTAMQKIGHPLDPKFHSYAKI